MQAGRSESAAKSFVRMLLPLIACMTTGLMMSWPAGSEAVVAVSVITSFTAALACSTASVRPGAIEPAPISRKNGTLSFILSSMAATAVLCVCFILIWAVVLLVAEACGEGSGFSYRFGFAAFVFSAAAAAYCYGGTMWVCYKTSFKSMIVRGVIFIVFSAGICFYILVWAAEIIAYAIVVLFYVAYGVEPDVAAPALGYAVTVVVPLVCAAVLALGVAHVVLTEKRRLKEGHYGRKRLKNCSARALRKT